jgi:signal transduction histidine kinase
MAIARAVDLLRPLPDAVTSARASALAWSRWPVFGWPWLWRRSLVAALAAFVLGVMVVLGVGAALGAWWLALSAGLHLGLALLAMATFGPALATAVRHARWPLRMERAAVVLAVLLGIVGAWHVDRRASSYLEGIVRPAMEQSRGKARVQVVVRRTAPAPSLLSPRTAANLLVVVGLYALFGGGWALRDYFAEPRRLQAEREHREMLDLRRQVQQSDLKLAVLQAQVEPHFLFNTLASLRSLIRQDPARAEGMLDALSDHLRATIPRLRADQGVVDSTLGQQLDLCSSYLALMQVRMGSRLRFEVEADAATRALPFPPLMLISLVENAIKHGIEPKAGPGWIGIHAAQADGVLEVRVEDDGRGLQPGTSSGIGLANIREQLRARYADRAGLAVSARAGGGVTATLRIPMEAA